MKTHKPGQCKTHKPGQCQQIRIILKMFHVKHFGKVGAKNLQATSPMARRAVVWSGDGRWPRGSHHQWATVHRI
jgi:hypothetical protein